jgi:protein involved in polysaccharide export with SLBB domain
MNRCPECGGGWMMPALIPPLLALFKQLGNTSRASTPKMTRGMATRVITFAGLLSLVMACGGVAQAQLEEFGIQNTNNAATLLQQQRETQQNQSEGECTDPDLANCGANGAAGGVPGSGQQNTRPQFPFQQPPSSYYTNGGYVPEQGMPQYIFRPQQPTEFQRFVGDATGVWLPLFGSNLFQGVPTTFSPLINIPVPQNYVLGPGDELLLQAWGQINFDLHLTVDRNGQIDVPRVGAVRVAGLKYSQLREFLQQQIGKNFRNFDLNANLGQLRTIQVYVVGDARRPGVYTISSLATLMNAAFATGGPAAMGSMRNIELRRNGVAVAHLDLYALILKGDLGQDAQLQPQDVIFYPSAGPQVAAFGSVGRPAVYELKGETTVGAVLDLAGGMTATASTTQAELERIEAGKTRHIEDISLDTAGQGTPVRGGDILRVFSIVPKFDNAVVLRGNVANPGRYGWHAGMKLSDLIPDAQSLLTREYWKQRARLGLPVLDYQQVPTQNPFADTQPRYQQYVVSGNEVDQRRAQKAQYAAGNPAVPQQQGQQNGNGQYSNGQSNNGQYSNGQYGNGQDNNNSSGNNAQSGSGNNNSGGNNNDAQGQNAGQTQNQGSSSNGTNQGPYLNGQMGTNASGSEGTIGPVNTDSTQQQNLAGITTVAGLAPPLPQNFPAKNLVDLPAPPIDWAYAVIERTDPKTLETTLIPFDLGRLVRDHDGSQDLELQPSDVVTIFSQADIRVPRAEQTRFVRIEGEVKYAGTYSVRPGETLREVVIRAGGLTPNAYLYGTSFSRESVRQQQQQRLNEYVNQLAQELSQSAVETEVSTTGGAAAGTQVQQQQAAAIAQLRALKATGRVVLNVQPDDHDLAALPAIPLEDGDHLVIPPMPYSVSVLGSVYNQSSFLFEQGRRAGGYLREAGGPTRLADPKHEFIVRADGSVLSRSFSSGKLLSSFDSEAMNPGDAVVVPQKLIKPSALAIFLQYSGVFSTLALATAAIAALK